MKYWDISYGKIIEGFSIFPSISVNWAIFQVNDKLPVNYNRYCQPPTNEFVGLS